MTVPSQLLVAAWTLLAAATTLLPAAELSVGPDPLERQAAADLRRELDRPGITPPATIHIGTPADHEPIAAAHARRPFVLTDNPESYHIAFRDGALYIVGAAPKGAMNGAYRLLNRGPRALASLDWTTLDEHAAPAFRYRIGDHLRTQKMPPGWTDDDQGRWYARHFVNIVWGEKFGPPLPYEVRRKYGLGLMLEASLPPTPEGTHWGDTGHKSPWWDDPANASAIYWWGRPSWYGKVKVVDPFDPVGRQAYLDHFNNLLARNPDTRILYCIFGDYSWAPNEDSTRISDGRPFGHTQEEAIREILLLMRRAIGQRDVIPAVWMWLLFPRQGKEKFMEEMAAEGIGVMYNEAGDNDCWTYLRDNFDSISLKLGPDGRTRFGPNYLPLVSIGGTCESVRPGVGMPLPHVGAGKLLKLHRSGVENFIIWWGSCEGWAYQANIEAMAEMVWNPAAFNPDHADPFNPDDPEPLVGSIARRDFGQLAPDVLRFWEAFDRALVDVDLAGNRTGLQNQSWYQRTGNYLIFLNGQTIPLIPSELAQREKVASLYPWILRPHAQENWAQVRRNLAAAIDRLAAIRAKGGSEEQQIIERLDSMLLNTWAFHRVFANMHNHMRAAQVMERLAHLPAESPRLKAELLPILADDLANTEALIEVVGRFPPNFFLSGKYERNDTPTRDAEIERLRAKIARTRQYIDEALPGDLAASGAIERTADGATVRLSTPALVETIFVRWKGDAPAEATIEVSADGTTWQAVDAQAMTGIGIIAAIMTPREVAAVRVGTDRPAEVEAIAVHGPPLLQKLAAVSGRFRAPFSPARPEHELVIDAAASAIELEVIPGSAQRLAINGRPIEAGAVRVPVSDVLRIDASAGGESRSWRIHVRRNVAIGATANADSMEGSFRPERAVDGQADAADDQSRWVSAAGDGGHWLALDLGDTRTLARAVVLHGHQRATSHAMRSFRLQASADGRTWTDIPGAAVTDNKSNRTELKFAPLRARHIRLVVDRSPDDRARVYELELYEP